MKIFGIHIPGTRFDFGDGQRSSNSPLPPPLLIPGGRMYPEYVASMRSLEKQMREHNETMTRAYAAGTTDHLNSDLRGTYNSANTEMFPSLYRIRAAARTVEKDTPHGKAVCRTLADNVVGDDPFELEMDDEKIGEDTADAIERAWKKQCLKRNFTNRRDMDASQAFRVLEMSMARDGNALMKIYPDYKYNEFGFTTELNEQDRLFETYSGFSGKDSKFGAENPIIASIEFHKEGKFPVAYWIASRHPGEAYGQMSEGKIYREQWGADRVILWSNVKTRCEQTLGMTELDAVMQPLWRLNQYQKSLTVAAIASCIKPFVLEKKLPNGMSMPADLSGDPAAMSTWLNGSPIGGQGSSDIAGKQQGTGVPMQNLSPGQERQLDWGVEAKILDPKFPVEAAEEFIKSNLREIAVGSGISYQHASGDFQNLGFIAGLMCQQPFQRYMRIRQNNFMANLMELFEKWLRAAILHGYFDKRGEPVVMSKLQDYLDATRFKAQQWEFVNPLVEAQTLILLAEAGHMTRQQVQDRLMRGMKMSKLVEILRKEYDLMKDADLMYDEVDVTRPQLSKGNPGETVAPPGAPEPSGADGAQPPSKKKTNNPSNRARRMQVVTEMLRDLGFDETGEPVGEMANGRVNGDH